MLHCGLKPAEEGDACEEALHLLSSTVEGAETWLWPSLIKALLDQTYIASVSSAAATAASTAAAGTLQQYRLTHYICRGQLLCVCET